MRSQKTYTSAFIVLFSIIATYFPTPVDSNPQLYGGSGYGSRESYGEPDDFAIIQINGRESEISTGGLLTGTVPLRGGLNVYSAELISGPVGFGFFFWSSSADSFVSSRVDQNVPRLEAAPPLSPPPFPFSSSSSSSSSSSPGGRRSRSRSSSPTDPPSDDNDNDDDPSLTPFLFPNAEQIFFYNLESVRNQLVAFVEWLDGSMTLQVVNLLPGSFTAIAALRGGEDRVGRWRFERTQRNIRRVAVLYAPRGRMSRCRLDMVMRQYEVVQDRPLVGPFYGVTGMVCYK